MCRSGHSRFMTATEAISRRVSCRAYRSDPVAQDHLLTILEAARLAPSACNQQPWRFAVVQDLGLRRRIVEEGFLPGINMDWAIEAPVHGANPPSRCSRGGDGGHDTHGTKTTVRALLSRTRSATKRGRQPCEEEDSWLGDGSLPPVQTGGRKGHALHRAHAPSQRTALDRRPGNGTWAPQPRLRPVPLSAASGKKQQARRLRDRACWVLTKGVFVARSPVCGKDTACLLRIRPPARPRSGRNLSLLELAWEFPSALAKILTSRRFHPQRAPICNALTISQDRADDYPYSPVFKAGIPPGFGDGKELRRLQCRAEPGSRLVGLGHRGRYASAFSASASAAISSVVPMLTRTQVRPWN